MNVLNIVKEMSLVFQEVILQLMIKVTVENNFQIKVILELMTDSSMAFLEVAKYNFRK